MRQSASHTAQVQATGGGHALLAALAAPATKPTLTEAATREQVGTLTVPGDAIGYK